jgi:hypothetical protein
LVAASRRGGSRVGKASDKDQHWQAGTLLLDSDYLANEVTRTLKDFRRRSRMYNKDLFMRIVFGIKVYDMLMTVDGFDGMS